MVDTISYSNVLACDRVNHMLRDQYMQEMANQILICAQIKWRLEL